MGGGISPSAARYLLGYDVRDGQIGKVGRQFLCLRLVLGLDA